MVQIVTWRRKGLPAIKEMFPRRLGLVVIQAVYGILRLRLEQTLKSCPDTKPFLSQTGQWLRIMQLAILIISQ